MLTELLDDFQRACVTASERYGTGVARDAARAAIVAHVAELSAAEAYWHQLALNFKAHVAELSAERDDLLQACRVVASAIRNLEGQPIQYSLAMDLSAALARVNVALEKHEYRPSKAADEYWQKERDADE